MPKTPRLHDMPTARRVFLGSLIGVAVGLLLMALRPTGLFESLELRFLDARTELFLGHRPGDSRIVLAEIHDGDVRRVQEAWGEPWPWPLQFNALAVRLMGEAGARVLVVDVYQLDRGATLEDAGLDPETVDDRNRARYAYEAEQGALLGEALRTIPSVLAFELADEPQYEVPARVAAATPRLSSPALEGAPEGKVRRGANLPVRLVVSGAEALGFANLNDDADGVVRRAGVVGRWEDRPVPSLGLAAAMLLTDGDVAFEHGGVRVGDAFQPLMPDGTFFVDFRGPHGTPYARVAPSDLLRWWVAFEESGEVPAEAREALAGKVVIWGINVAGQEDVVATPLPGRYHGPEYQATALDNLLHGDGRVRVPAFLDATLLFGLTIGLGAAAGAIRSRLLPHLVPLLAALALLAGGLGLFAGGRVIDVFTPFLGILLTWGITSIVRVLTEGRRNRWLEGTFGRYLAPSIIEALKADPGLVELGGRRRRITILFSDVAGFTRISEALASEDVVTLLNRYLTAHSAAVMDEGGVVDKFEGDAVMAFFGDPVPSEDHAERACRAALEAVRSLPRLRPVWEGFGLASFSIRVGLNTGEAIVGNMGSAQRFDYTCMGDAVNLASRLEGANKAFGSVIMIGSQTRADAGASILAKPLASVIVVGRSRPEPVFELIAMEDGATESERRHVEAFTRAADAVRADDLDGARRALADAARARPDDGPVRWLEDLVERLERGEIPRPWNGVVELTGK